ncbi:hypothetical protein EFW17_14750 [Halostreptopolyspora alba]|uniref:Uncharacterized protein n=1 Tax=Halostreptopolyspora alba TaxID=2487137 RepID=A0A3N0E7Q7_9ACTN|nr:hypothetical protein EFW17_14750 [Nocardiopsaceae bacterium YIM 96095]
MACQCRTAQSTPPSGAPPEVLGVRPLARTTVPATDDVTPLAIVLSLGVAATLTTVGVLAFRHRDVVPS